MFNWHLIWRLYKEEKTPGPFKCCVRGWKRIGEWCDLKIKKLQQFTKVCAATRKGTASTNERTNFPFMTTWLAIWVCRRGSTLMWLNLHQLQLQELLLMPQKTPREVMTSRSFTCSPLCFKFLLSHCKDSRLCQRAASNTKNSKPKLTGLNVTK